LQTIGLNNIWLLGKLSKSGFATWKLGVAFTLSTAVLCMLVAQTGSPGGGTMISQYYAVRLPLLTIAGVVGIGTIPFLTLVLVRTTESDLARLDSCDAVRENLEGLQASWHVLLPLMVVFALSFGIVQPSNAAEALQVSMAKIYAYLFTSLPAFLALFILNGISGTFLGILLVIVFRQVTVLSRISTLIDLDLSNLEQYTALSNPAIRLTFWTIAVYSVFPLLLLVVDYPGVETSLTKAVLGMLPLSSLILAAYFYPLVRLRNRISRLRDDELSLINQALVGDDQALSRLSISGLGLPGSTAELLMYKLYVESRHDWPITIQVQRLVLFGLLPPFSWIIAAVIENTLY
jgi:hypothetical protein